MEGGIKRHKRMNPTDNEDEKTKGKEREREIERLNRAARAAGFLPCYPGHWETPEGANQNALSSGLGLTQVVGPAFRLIKPPRVLASKGDLPPGPSCRKLEK